MGNVHFKQNAYIDSEIKKTSKLIVAYLEANTFVLADSYGTGSLMLSNNPGFKDYMMDAKRINPARKGKAIAGRPKGTYKDIFGNTRTTTGAFEGDNIEGKVVNPGKMDQTFFKKTYKILPVAPSYAIQLANNWLWKTYLPRAFKNAMEKVSFTKYLIES